MRRTVGIGLKAERFFARIWELSPESADASYKGNGVPSRDHIQLSCPSCQCTTRKALSQDHLHRMRLLACGLNWDSMGLFSSASARFLHLR